MNVSLPKDPHEKRGYNDSLRAVAIQASQFLTSNSVDETIPAILATIGDALSVDRVLVLENKPTGIALCYAWQQASVPQVMHDDFSKYPSNTAEVREWFRPAFQGRWLSGKCDEVSGPVAELFRGLEIKAILIVPIVVAGKVWGFIGVDACKAERDWVTVEVELMEILANLIGTTILRDRDIKSLRENEQKFRAVTETAQDAIIVVDSKGVVQYWNPAAQRILGYTPAEAIGQNVHSWLAPTRYNGSAKEQLGLFGTSGTGPAIGKTRELAAIRKDGVEIPVELALASMQVDGEWRAVGILRDISSRKTAEQRIAWLARNDVLTGLSNRTVFVDELQSAIAVGRRKPAGHFAVYYLDLDHFKDINDTLGHPAGDLLLKGVAERLTNTMRETDIVARFGGDEFAILATELSDPTDAGIVAGKLLSAMAQPFLINGGEIRTSATIGIATHTEEQDDAESLLAHADVALYHAKSEGRDTFRFFTAAMDHAVHQRVRLLAELREALQRDELFLVYQPQVDMETQAIVGLEALVRWQHPSRGIISPGQFIPAAENSGLIISIGQRVLELVCRQARGWLDAGFRLPIIAFNVSPTQFKAPFELSEEIDAAARRYGINSAGIEIELTETALMQASRHSSEVVQRLRNRGVRIAIDDFGTGYSCLDYLRRFPASRIKIAQTFVSDITSNSGSAAITRAAISLGRELSLSVIAEGVETAEQVALLQDWGCREAQGYFFAKPLPAAEVSALLRVGRARGESYLGAGFSQ